MRWTLVPRFLLVVLYAVSATATIGFTQVPDLMFTGTSNLIAWGGGDGTSVTISLVIGSSDNSNVRTLGTVWTGVGTSYFWPIGTSFNGNSLVSSGYYGLKITQSGISQYSYYFSIVNQPPSSSTSINQATVTSITTQISSSATTVTSISTYTPTTSATSSSSPHSSSTVLTPTTNTDTSGTNTGTSKKLSAGALAGIVIGVIAVVALIIVLIVFILRRSFRKDPSNDTPEIAQAPAPGIMPMPNHQKNSSVTRVSPAQQYSYPQQYQQPYPEQESYQAQQYQPSQYPASTPQQYQQSHQQEQYAPLLGHEVDSPQGMQFSPASPTNSYAMLHNNTHHQNVMSVDGSSDTGRTAPPGYEKDVIASIQPMPAVQQAPPPHGHRPAHEMA